MATFLSSGLVAALALQTVAAPIPGPGDTGRAALWGRVAADSTDGQAWFELGRVYVRLAEAYHQHRALPPSAAFVPDTAWARAVLDTADLAFARAARLGAGTRTEDSAQVLRVFIWGERAYLAWEASGVEAAAAGWRAVPEDLRLPPVLEELGENLLRSCPRQGVLLTAGDADSHAAWYMRFARGLRPDLLVLPLARWRTDSVFRGRVLRDSKLRIAAGRTGEPALRALADRRPLCASMAFERAPELRPRLRWRTQPLVWMAGPERRAERVPPQDFVFAALRLALDQHDTWSPPAVALYRRAADASGGLCGTLRNYGVRQEVGCR